MNFSIFNSIVFASDHAGYLLKESLKKAIPSEKILDLGTYNEEPVDYPVYAVKLVKNICQIEGKPLGVLICGTGIGMSIVANRYKGIRAALCYSTEAAKLARQHNDANVLVLGSRLLDFKTAKDCLEVFSATKFESGRHAMRLAMIDGGSNDK